MQETEDKVWKKSFSSRECRTYPEMAFLKPLSVQGNMNISCLYKLPHERPYSGLRLWGSAPLLLQFRDSAAQNAFKPRSMGTNPMRKITARPPHNSDLSVVVVRNMFLCALPRVVHLLGSSCVR